MYTDGNLLYGHSAKLDKAIKAVEKEMCFQIFLISTQWHLL